MLLTFIGSTVIFFSVLMFVLRPSAEQKAINKRLRILNPEANADNAGDKGEAEKLLKSGQKLAAGWLEQILEDTKISHNLEKLILQANSATTPSKVLTQCGFLGVGALIAVALFTQNVFFTLIASVLAGLLPVLLLRIKRARRVNAFDKSLADSIDIMSRSLRAGHALNSAISVVAEQSPEPAKTEWATVFRQQNYGMSLRDALMQMMDRIPSADLRVLVTGVLVQKDTGGNLAEILDRLVYVIRERLRIKGEIKTHTAQGRMTGYILTALPVVLLVLLNLVSPNYSKVLFDDPLGQKLMYVGVVLLVLGTLVIRQIVNGIEV